MRFKLAGIVLLTTLSAGRCLRHAGRGQPCQARQEDNHRNSVPSAEVMVESSLHHVLLEKTCCREMKQALAVDDVSN